MKTVLILGGIVAVVLLAYIAGQQMSADAMAVVIGVVVGIAASIPTSIVMLVLFGQRREEPAPPQSMPSVMIVNPGPAQWPALQSGEWVDAEWTEGRWN